LGLSLTSASTTVTVHIRDEYLSNFKPNLLRHRISDTYNCLSVSLNRQLPEFSEFFELVETSDE